MDQVWEVLRNEPILAPRFIYAAGWISALFCCAISYLFARRVKQPRLFTAVALFAAAWALIAAGVENRFLDPNRSPAFADRVQDVATFLFVYSGVILAREDTRLKWMPALQHSAQTIALVLLFLLVVRSQFAGLPLGPAEVQLYGGETMSVLGFLALAMGAYALAPPKRPFWKLERAEPFWMLAGVLVVYIGIGFARTVELAGAVGERPLVGPGVGYGFIACRLALTWLYCGIVLSYSRQFDAPVGLRTDDVPYSPSVDLK